MTKLLIILTFIFFNSNVLACNNNIEIRLPSTTVDIPESETEKYFTIEVVKTGIFLITCNFEVGIDEGQAGSYNRMLFKDIDTISYQVFKEQSANILKDQPDTNNSDELFSGRLRGIDPNGTTVTFQARANITELQSFLPAGTYIDNLNIRLYRNNNSGTVFNEKTIQIRRIINESLALSIVPTGAPFDPTLSYQSFDLGLLTNVNEISFDVVTVANLPYSLSISSLNNGKLKHQSVNKTVDYTFWVNNQITDLSSSAGTPIDITSNTMTTETGDRYAMRVQNVAVTTQPSGTYTDTINFTITAN